MLSNYLKVTLRNLWRNPTFSSINILGLSLGFTCSLLILLWIKDELSMDSFQKNRNTLYTIIQRTYADDKMGIGYETPGLLGEEMKKAFPEIEYATNYSTWGNLSTFRVGDKIMKATGEYASEDFLRLFSFPILQGDAPNALNSINSIAISGTLATSFFGSPKNAIGKTIRFENKENFAVSAVFDVPTNSSLRFDYLISWNYFKRENDWVKDWNNVSPHTTIQLREDANPAQFRTRIQHFLDNLNTKQTAGYRAELDMQRFDATYLNGAFKNRQIGGGRIEYIWLFGLIAIFILLIACVNFMNLTTARSLQRAKEIGIRKTSGAKKTALIAQFIGEAVLFATLAMILSTCIITFLLPVFNTITGKQMQLPIHDTTFFLILAAITATCGLISGSYPAFFLSSFNPVQVLKGTFRPGSGTSRLRKGLVIFQFTLSSLLIIGTIIVSKQIRFIQATNLGFDREGLVTIPLEGALAKDYDIFKQQLTKMPGILHVTEISQSPVQTENYWINDIRWEGKDLRTLPAFAIIYSEYDLAKTMRLQIKDGRDFAKDFPTDTSGYILNESAVARMGISNPVGRSLTCMGKKGPIIGVVRDFHFNSLHKAIAPLIIAYGVSEGNSILVRTAAGQTTRAIASLEKACKQFNPQFPFSYQFADEAYQRLYSNEEVVGRLSYLFATLAIAISCLGLLGLSAYTAEQRGKEIAMRKVLGASLAQLFFLLSRDFLRLVLFAFAIAIPVSWWIMTRWLEDFAYRTRISWWIFVAAAAISLLVTMATVSFHVVKAALASPIKNLKAG
jgi:putative ABC transport system permease protein